MMDPVQVRLNGNGRASSWRACAPRWGATIPSGGLFVRALGLLGDGAGAPRLPRRNSSSSGTSRGEEARRSPFESGRSIRITGRSASISSAAKIKQKPAQVPSRRARCLGKRGKGSGPRSRLPPESNIPHFRYGPQAVGRGVGRAAATTPATRSGRARPKPGQGPGPANRPGPTTLLEVEVSMEGPSPPSSAEGAQAPQHRGQGQGAHHRQEGPVRRASAATGPGVACAHFRRTFQAGAAAADLDGGVYNPKNPLIVPIPRTNKRLPRSWKSEPPAAVQRRSIVYMIGRLGPRWATSRRRSSASSPSGSTPGCARSTRASRSRYNIIHERRWAKGGSIARPSSRPARSGRHDDFSSAYKLVRQGSSRPSTRRAKLENIYPFHFSDGDNLVGRTTP